MSHNFFSFGLAQEGGEENVANSVPKKKLRKSNCQKKRYAHSW